MDTNESWLLYCFVKNSATIQRRVQEDAPDHRILKTAIHMQGFALIAPSVRNLKSGLETFGLPVSLVLKMALLCHWFVRLSIGQRSKPSPVDG